MSNDDADGSSLAETKQKPTVADPILSTLKLLGRKISEECLREGKYLPPVLGAFTARIVTLENDQFDLLRGLSASSERELLQLAIRKALLADDPTYETIKMQVLFETLYAAESQALRTKKLKQDSKTRQLLEKVVELGTNIQSNTQVANLYRAIFKLMVSNSGVDEALVDRNVEREIAAALESVFPQAGLNSFNLMSVDDKRMQITGLVAVVLGIRLFNREIKKGGAGFIDVAGMATKEVDDLFGQLEREATEVGDVCFTYADIVNLEYHKRGTISASLDRLQQELVNRRQYVLFVNQLQHEVLESVDIIRECKEQLYSEMEQLKALVGLRTSVPKDQVYPKFQAIAAAWLSLVAERDKNIVRNALLAQLLPFRDSFTSSLLESDIDLLDQNPIEEKTSLNPDDFVVTETDAMRAATAAASDEERERAGQTPVRLTRETAPDFMRLPLVHQGYCPWTIVTRDGLLMLGNPGLGIVRYRDRHYSFCSYAAMQAFCEDPERFVQGVVKVACKRAALIQLLNLQRQIPYADVSDLFSLADIDARTLTLIANTCDQGTQYDLADIEIVNDPNYQWNEWELRRQAIRMADLCSKRTKSSQTHLSHFRREAESQVYLPKRNKDGSMAATGTQTGIEKGTNVERTRKYVAGLRGHPETKMSVVTLTHPKFVVDGSNPPLSRDYEPEAEAKAGTAVTGPVRKNVGPGVQLPFTEHVGLSLSAAPAPRASGPGLTGPRRLLGAK